MIKNFWTEYSAGGIIAEAYPLVIEGLLSQKVPTQRVMPYYLSQPVDVQEEITLIMPEDWDVTASDVKISGEGFNYFSTFSGSGNKVKILCSYEVFESYVNAEHARDFLTKREEIMNDLSFNLTYNKGAEGFKISWWVLTLSILVFIACILFGKTLFYSYNPIPQSSQDLQIGGWLVLLAIGISITPIRMAMGFTDLLDYLDENSWTALKLAYGDDKYLSLGALIITELVVNIAFLVFSILNVVLFYLRRTSAPMLVSVFIVANLIFVITDAYVAAELLNDDSFEESLTDIVRSVIYAVIWVSYLQAADRVKNTFVKTTERG